MKKLLELANNINSYNFKGTNRLSPIKLAIIFKKKHALIIDEIITDLQCEKSHASFELMGLSGYTIMRSSKIQGV
jgi:DNA-binding transcriptional regulator GbsR (MarR family)